MTRTNMFSHIRECFLNQPINRHLQREGSLIVDAHADLTMCRNLSDQIRFSSELAHGKSPAV